MRGSSNRKQQFTSINMSGATMVMAVQQHHKGINKQSTQVRQIQCSPLNSIFFLQQQRKGINKQSICTTQVRQTQCSQLNSIFFLQQQRKRINKQSTEVRQIQWPPLNSNLFFPWKCMGSFSAVVPAQICLLFLSLSLFFEVRRSPFNSNLFLVAPCCSQGATLQVTLRCHWVVCPWQDPPPYDWLS